MLILRGSAGAAGSARSAGSGSGGSSPRPWHLWHLALLALLAPPVSSCPAPNCPPKRRMRQDRPQMMQAVPDRLILQERLRSESGTKVCFGVGVGTSTGAGETRDFSSPCSYFSCQYISDSCLS